MRRRPPELEGPSPRALMLDLLVREDPEEMADTDPERARANTMLDWSHLAPEPKFGALDFRRFPYQREWYTEEIARAREVVFLKSTQIGLSAYAWRLGARSADIGDTVMYVFPTDDAVKDFGDARIEPSIQMSPYLQGRIPSHYVRQKALKRIGAGWLYLRGTKSRVSAQSVDADLVVIDEYDEHGDSGIAQIERRLSGAAQAGRVPRVRRFGIPHLGSYGIDLAFQRSDRRRWMVDCPGCGETQDISWEGTVRWTVHGSPDVHRAGRDDREQREIERAWRACRSCEESLEPVVARGRWVPTNPGHQVIGYHVSRLIVPSVDLVAIVKNSRKTKPADVEAFWENDLGLPYSPAEAGLSREIVMRQMALGQPSKEHYLQTDPTAHWPVSMGVDCASERDLSVRIDEHLDTGQRRALLIAEVADFEALDELMRLYRVQMVVIDSLPERRLARAFAARWPGRVALARYDETNPDQKPLRYDADDNMVILHRTEAIDAMMDGFRVGRNLPTSDPPPNYVDQMVAMKRRVEEMPSGKLRRVYVTTGSRGDDFAHAEVYALAASELMALGRLSDHLGGDVALTTEDIGYEEVPLQVEDEVMAGAYDAGFGEEW